MDRYGDVTMGVFLTKEKFTIDGRSAVYGGGYDDELKILDTGDVCINVSGQYEGHMDKFLRYHVKRGGRFAIFNRVKKDSAFVFVGTTSISDVSESMPGHTLSKYKFKVYKEDHVNMECERNLPGDKTTGAIKRAAIHHQGFDLKEVVDSRPNFMSCFIKLYT